MESYKIKILYQKKEIIERCNLEIFKLNEMEILYFEFSPIYLPLFLDVEIETFTIIISETLTNKEMIIPNIKINKKSLYELYSINGGQQLYNHIEEFENLSVIFDIQNEKDNYCIKKITIIKN